MSYMRAKRYKEHTQQLRDTKVAEQAVGEYKKMLVSRTLTIAVFAVVVFTTMWNVFDKIFPQP